MIGLVDQDVVTKSGDVIADDTSMVRAERQFRRFARLTERLTDRTSDQTANREHRHSDTSHSEHDQKGRNEVKGQGNLDESASVIARNGASIPGC
jgi:hypothetical protein